MKRAPIAIAVAVAAIACGGSRVPPRDDPSAPCASLDAARCATARGLAAAAPWYQDEPHALLLATGAFASGRGVARGERGDRAIDRACARVAAPTAADVDPAVIDYSFVGVAIDATLVSADANVAPLLADGDHVVRLVAIALARDRDGARALAPGPAVTARTTGCACGDATHVAGETKWGALLSYDAKAPRVRRPTRAIDLARAALADPDARVRETRVGAMRIDGFAPYLAGRAAPPLAFHVTQPAPVAYALRPIDEACPGAIPAPEIAPSPVDFGVAPYGTEATRSVRVVSRASIDLDALVGARTVRLPARGAIDLPLAWTPDGDAWTCETQTRDEAIHFVPASRDARAAPREQPAHVLETIRTGRPTIRRAEPVEPTPRDKRAEPLVREWSCLPDFVPSACAIEHAACAGRACLEATAAPTPGGCRFACRGDGGAPCRFDAVMECRLRCAE